MTAHEKTKQADLIGFTATVLNANGWSVELHGTRKGFPNVVAVKDGRLLMAWAKTEKGELTMAQKPWLRLLDSVAAKAPGVLTVAVWRPSDMDDIYRLARGEAK